MQCEVGFTVDSYNRKSFMSFECSESQSKLILKFIKELKRNLSYREITNKRTGKNTNLSNFKFKSLHVINDK